ncbi:hypothetical protein BZA70DRAFT_37022 [Myxozyma melibiosi]|uniref:GCS light chain n=1 Tax=Myxozyma melibiosi TaxID=54550 RepID=A0ABR1FE74_9ASCO
MPLSLTSISRPIPLNLSFALRKRSQRKSSRQQIFFPSGYSASARSQALNSALAKLRQSMPPSAAITYLNLSFPEITFADNDDDDDDDSSQDDRPESDLLTPDILDLWRTASKATGIYNVQHLGVSEFSAARLHALIKFADKSGCVKPAVNQINIRDCCVLPPSLVNLAKSHGVKLLTHNDNFNILPVDNVPEFVSLVGSAAADSPAEWAWNWLIKITTVVADRGVVYGQGWMVEFAEAAK